MNLAITITTLIRDTLSPYLSSSNNNKRGHFLHAAFNKFVILDVVKRDFTGFHFAPLPVGRLHLDDGVFGGISWREMWERDRERLGGLL